MGSNIWQGKKVKLRAVESSDFENYFYNGEHIDSDAQRSGDRTKAPYSRELVKERVESLAKEYPGSEDNFLMIEDMEGNAVGNINTHSCSRVDGTFEYGLGIREKFRGNGFAFEAIKLVLNFYFNELAYQKVNVKVYSYNEGSIKLHEKLAFVLEGRIRRSFYGNGNYHDILCYGITREEFNSMDE